jgi:hypothetical protein
MITHYNFSKITPLTDIYKVVARTGFEPIQRESKSLVLPLHHRAIKIGAGSGNRTRIASLEDWHSTVELYPRCKTGGPDRIRTCHILLAKQTLYQMSYWPVKWRLGKDLNLRGLLNPGALAKLCIRPLCHPTVNFQKMAVEEGFEPPEALRPLRFSRAMQ